MRVKLAPLALAVAVSVTQIASAAEHINTLDQVVVTATRSEANVSSISGTVQVIDSQEIQEQTQPGQKLSDVLEKLVPGMGPSTQAINDRTQSVRGRRLLILIDGVSQADNRQISRHLTTIRPENIQRIEVISGASAIYGGGATGGVINIITKSAGKDGVNFTSEAGLKLSDNSVNAYTLSQSINGRQGNFDFLVNGTFESRDGLFDADGDRINPEPAQGSRSDTDTKDVFVKLGYDLDEEKRLEATIQYLRDDMDTDYGVVLPEFLTNDGSIPEATEGYQLDDQFYTHRDAFTLQYTDSDFYDQALKIQSFYREFNTQANPYPTAMGRNLPADIYVNQSITEAEVYGINLTLSKDFSERFHSTYGIDFEVDQGKQTAKLYDSTAYFISNGLTLTPTGAEYDNAPAVDGTTWALFIQNGFDISEQLTANFGIRHEETRLDIKDYNPIAESWLLGGAQSVLKGDTKKYDATLFNLGFVYHLNDSNDLFVNYSQGFEVPDASRILRTAIPEDSTLPDGTPRVTRTSLDDVNLDAIKTDSYELGWRGTFDQWNGFFTAFYNESDHTIDFNEDHSVDLLDQKRKVYGFETGFDYFVNDNWFLGATYAFTEGRTYNEDLNKWLDLQAAEVSPEKTTAYVAFEQDEYTARLQATSFADYDKGRAVNSRGAEVKREAEGYTTVDLLTSYHTAYGTFGFGINNLLNEDYETIYSQWARQTYNSNSSAHKAEGRTYTLSYRIEY